MRSVFLVLLSFVVLGGSFAVYTRLQIKKPHGGHDAIAQNEPPVPSSIDGQSKNRKLPPGTEAWYNHYDESTGVLKNRFRAARYQPLDDGTVQVIAPVAEFFMPNHQMMRLTGDTGDIDLPEGTSTSSTGSDAPRGGAPKRGQIHHCTIDLFNLFPDSTPGIVDEKITMNNVQFDNETLLITTESFTDDDGTHVPADQVLVQMRGKKYDFDGRGLKLKWNVNDGRLELLEIAHGEQLTLRDTSALSGTFGGEKTQGAKPPAAKSIVAPARSGQAAASVMLVSDVSSQVPNPPPSTGRVDDAAKSRPPPEPLPYFATFDENVRVSQGSEIHVNADEMVVNFTTRKESARPVSATNPALSESLAMPNPWLTQAASAQKGDDLFCPRASTPGQAARAGVLADKAVPARRPGSSERQENPARRGVMFVRQTMPPPAACPGVEGYCKNNAPDPTGSATQPAAAPLVVRWTGKLRMVPATGDQAKVSAGDAVVELTGNPVIVRRTPLNQQEGDDVRAAKIIYRTSTGGVRLYNSPTVPRVTISKLLNGRIDPTTTITTHTLEYGMDAAGQRIAVLTGPGHAAIPMQSEAGQSKKAASPDAPPMDARWRDGARVYLADNGKKGKGTSGEMTVEHIELAGDVVVKHPRLALNSQALSLFFEPTARADDSSRDTPGHGRKRPRPRRSAPRDGQQDGALRIDGPERQKADH